MAKIYELEEDVLDVFETAIAEANLEQMLKIGVFGKKSKTEIYKVGKANDITNYKAGLDAVILVDEDIFIQLNPDQQKMIAEEAVCGISFSDERDSMKIEKPNIQTFTGILKKYTNEKVLSTKETILLALNSREQEEKEAKAAKKK